MNVRDLGRSLQPQGIYHNGRYIGRLQHGPGIVSSCFSSVHLHLHRRCRPTQENTQDAYALGIDFLSQAIGEGSEAVFCGRVLPDTSPRIQSDT